MALFDRSVLSTPALIAVLLLAAPGCGDDTSSSSGTTPEPFVPEAYGQWLKFEPEGAVCANGSQYKFFVNFSETSSNVVIFLEGGVACSNDGDGSNGRPFNTDCIKEAPGAKCIRDDYPAVYLHLDELEPLSAAAEQPERPFFGGEHDLGRRYHDRLAAHGQRPNSRRLR